MLFVTFVFCFVHLSTKHCHRDAEATQWMHKYRILCNNFTKFVSSVFFFLFFFLSIWHLHLKLIRSFHGSIYSLTWNYLNLCIFCLFVRLFVSFRLFEREKKNALRFSLMHLCTSRVHDTLQWAEPKRSALGLYLMTNSNLNLFFTEMGTMHCSQAIYITACSLFSFVLCVLCVYFVFVSTPYFHIFSVFFFFS